MVTSYLDFAENMAQRKIPLTMQDRGKQDLMDSLKCLNMVLLKDAGKSNCCNC